MMHREVGIVLILLFTSLFVHGQSSVPQALFVENQGQWKENFRYKVRLTNGALFFTGTGYTCVLNQSSQKKSHLGHTHHHLGEMDKDVSTAAYEMEWVGAGFQNTDIQPGEELPFKHNYYLGKEPSRWKSNIKVFPSIRYRDVYPGIDVEYLSSDGRMKYNILLGTGGDVSQVKMKFNGVQDYFLREDLLVLQTGLGEVHEWIPESYQIIDGTKIPVECSYTEIDGIIGFELGDHDENHPVVIDPVLEFSTFTGSRSDNWGFTATYDNNGGFYGGGVVFSDQYPATPGVFQTDFKGQIDIAINKFSEDGSQLEYATYIGGDGVELPHSMIVNRQGELLVLGNTGSADFPTTANAFQEVFAQGEKLHTQLDTIYKNGSNIVLFKLNATGTSMLSSTFFGGSVGEGVNQKLDHNYGDNSRGEVIVLDNGNVAIASSSLSPDLPIANTGADLTNNKQNAVVAVFNPDLSNLVWGTYYGGSGDEAGYSLRTDGSNVFLCGGTTSPDLSTGTNAVETNFQGNTDGFLAKFNAADGQFINGTYIGTSALDQSFMAEVDKHGKVYAYGQSKGSMPISPGRYSNSGSYQFVQKYDNDLTALEWGTEVGSGISKTDLVPTAFMVDQCLNIYLSGWGGDVNYSYTMGGNTRQLPVSTDAFQSTTDGSDFYFMVLGRDAENLLFGSYFGGSSDEHVDGGTSRFSPEGIMYQAACAGCFNSSGFPTTPSAFSPTKPLDSCNFGAIKIDFQQTVRSIPDINFDFNVDTLCNELHVKFSNNSISANRYFWDFGNGHTSKQHEPNTVFEEFGEYTITLVAEDTICDLLDTSSIIIEHTEGIKPKAKFDAKYAGCDGTFKVELVNASPTADRFQWDFGDGGLSNAENPIYHYADTGTYEVRLVARDSICKTFDTAYAEVIFKDTSLVPKAHISHPDCGKGIPDIEWENARNRYTYSWDFSGGTAEGPDPHIRFEKEGYYLINLLIEDTVCHKEYEYEHKLKINQLHRDIFIPNAFSPNNDGRNEKFILTGDKCLGDNNIWIFNRWGEVVFESPDPFEKFWDGTCKGKPVPSGVYTYILNSGGETKRGHITLFR